MAWDPSFPVKGTLLHARRGAGSGRSACPCPLPRRSPGSQGHQKWGVWGVGWELYLKQDLPWTCLHLPQVPCEYQWFPQEAAEHHRVHAGIRGEGPFGPWAGPLITQSKQQVLSIPKHCLHVGLGEEISQV